MMSDRRFHHALLLSAILCASLSLSACVAVPERAGPPPAATVVVARPPPAELVETPPPPPGPREVWVWQRGHWHWDGFNYRWEPGHWKERPAYASAWIPAHWDQRPNGYVFVEGRWQ